MYAFVQDDSDEQYLRRVFTQPARQCGHLARIEYGLQASAMQHTHCDQYITSCYQIVDKWHIILDLIDLIVTQIHVTYFRFLTEFLCGPRICGQIYLNKGV